MSVVNKMLQDLEARQSQTDEINADYQPPQKKQSKLLVLVLLVLAVAAIIFALKNESPLFGGSTNKEPTAAEPLVVVQKMSVATDKKQLETASVLPLDANIELRETETDVVSTNHMLAKQKILPPEPTTIITKLAPLPIATNDQQLETQNNTKFNLQRASEPTSSFSMTGSSQANNTSSLKQRIAESLNNDDFDLAQRLLNELLENEPDNIKARKKLASLLFAQGHYARTKLLLVQGIELHPTKSDLRLMLARLYVIQKEHSLALDTLADNMPNLDNQTDYLAYRAALAQQLKQTKLAKSDYQTLSTIEPTNAKWWLGLAIAEDQLGDVNMAVQAYSKASTLDQLDESVSDFIQQRILVLAGAQ